MPLNHSFRLRLRNVIRQNPVVLVLACAAAGLLFVINERSYHQTVSKIETLAQMRQAHTNLLALERNLLDAETGQRGYLLTGRDEYLQPYLQALAKVDQIFKALQNYYAQRPDTLATMAQLHQTIDAKLSELALTLRLYDEGKDGEVNAVLLSNVGKEHMDLIRQVSAGLRALETNSIEAGRADLVNSLRVSRVGLAGVSLLALLALLLYLLQAMMQENHEREMRQQIQAERDRLDEEVKQRTQQLTELAQHLQTAREDERHRLARDLHDELGALLTSAKLDAARIKSRLAGTAPEALERLAHLVSTLNSSIALGRRIIEDLRPSTLGNLGLVPTLEILVREFGETSGVPVEIDLAEVSLQPSAELMIYRLVQEALTNIGKYARAKQVWVSLGEQNGDVRLAVRDDGVGFDARARPASVYGLVGMRYRVEAEGGTLTVQSAPGQGTRLTMLLPAKRRAVAG